MPTRRYTFTINNKLASLNDIPAPGSFIEYSCIEQPNPMVTDVLLTTEFNPRILPPGTSVGILLNGQPAEYTALIKPDDKVDIVISGQDTKSSAM
ncbi:hypothetical protein SDC9_171089 [bioreactor metagenome]|uniref:Uncharacterized protein n=1 Tax=bioreactor metagenome TaxID=1076179 RepID=A0A645GC46_9ZZZZ